MVHRPCLGESLLLERGICRFSAQRLGSGETRRFWQGRAAAFPQVGELTLLAGSPKPGSCAALSLPSRDVVPRSPLFLAERPEFLPSRDVARSYLNIVPPWERLVRCMWGASPKPGRCAPASDHRPCLGGWPLAGPGASPEQGRCASAPDHRPASGETGFLRAGASPKARYCAPASDHRPGLGEASLLVCEKRLCWEVALIPSCDDARVALETPDCPHPRPVAGHPAHSAPPLPPAPLAERLKTC